ncbi:ATP-binding cassette domain-containing protein [Leuconostoc gelidum]|jgi:ABC-2 type transport system ATP-binding protein|uniref:ATP-binding cassette domain-containing protein n=1 Tax=Leuconostoc gelidum TaxID=1244 RepID=UPI001F016F02|nr:ATP-binding cassette domain-containing protein [Leuconostoc gelidum]
MLEIKNLSVTYSSKVALTVPNLNINKGEIIGVMGESGSGKSTLVNSCLGLVRFKGQVTLETDNAGAALR